MILIFNLILSIFTHHISILVKKLIAHSFHLHKMSQLTCSSIRMWCICSYIYLEDNLKWIFKQLTNNWSIKLFISCKIKEFLQEMKSYFDYSTIKKSYYFLKIYEIRFNKWVEFEVWKIIWLKNFLFGCNQFRFKHLLLI